MDATTTTTTTTTTTIPRTTTQPPCPDCHAGFEHCHDVSVEHVDGITECLDPSCTLPHVLHTWQLSCSVLDPPCPCVPDEYAPPLLAAA